MLSQESQKDIKRPLAKLSDEELISASQKGDTKTFDALIIRHHSKLLGYISSRMEGSDSAKDVTNQAFHHAWKHIKEYTPTPSFTSWVRKIAHNLMYDHFRSEQRRSDRAKSHPLFILENAHSREALRPDDLLMQIEEKSLQQERIREAIQNLPDQSRKLVTLRLQGLSYNDIATQSQIPIGTVMSGLSRTRKLLKSSLS